MSGSLNRSGWGSRIVEPLRMMAQDVREEIAAAAVSALGAQRLPEAARALQTLLPVVTPELRSLVERSLRKLQFIGVSVADLPDPDPNWRALVSSVDGLGQQSVWFILDGQGVADTRFLNVLLSDRAGAVEAVGYQRVTSSVLPPLRPEGHIHDIVLPDGTGAVLMLEASFDLGRRLILEALVRNRETQIPVAGVLRLFSPWLWQVGGADSLPPKAVPSGSTEDAPLVAISDRLLMHPSFTTWTMHGDAILQAAEESLRHPAWDLDMWARRLTSELLAQPAIAQVFSRRLRAMSEWLLLAGNEALSRLALSSARTIQAGDSQDHPFVRALVRRDLDMALHSLKQNTGPLVGSEQFQ
jgi:hypothetical protein